MGEGFRFIPPDSERPKPIVPDVERGPEPEVRLGTERAKSTPILEPQIQAETYDRAYWTPERISSNVASFFEKLDRNERRMKAENERLLEQAIKEEGAREIAKRAIAEREMAEAKTQQREQFQQGLEETETERQFRHTLEWMIEQSHDQIQDLAINFLNGSATQDTDNDE